MTEGTPRYLKGLLLLLLLLSVPAGGTAAVFTTLPGRSSPGISEAKASLAPERALIVLVLEDRIEDPRLLARAKEKVTVLQDRQVRLISSLCRRIVERDQTTGAEIAFSLVTELIILS
jgi:hypothetical protein